MSSLLSSQVAIIAGASRGIGLSIARLFTAEGASCLLVARSEPALRIAVRELEALKPQTTQPPGQEGSDILVEQKLQTGVEIRPGLGTELGERAVEEEIVVGTDQNGQQRFDYVVGEVGEESTWREVLKKEVCLVENRCYPAQSQAATLTSSNSKRTAASYDPRQCCRHHPLFTVVQNRHCPRKGGTQHKPIWYNHRV